MGFVLGKAYAIEDVSLGCSITFFVVSCHQIKRQSSEGGQDLADLWDHPLEFSGKDDLAEFGCLWYDARFVDRKP